ncbi:hypothetical protein PV08_03136 [Exophiala spinifera]|uniref:Zn(2)-C6 fungal-type domain-containing protein n=1 Tax=Exophiala spinifera TaxID=91928 RepID=A0A0D2A1K9_9EURO|nr:uncharacterized protein PV08_03136 [Exophiala spinifera]KIW18847.1 hypothetical protein PV08_03136 [Exophiala spinifera]
MSHSIGAPRLRVKTGCQTCRTSKKKCDEGRPVCQRCLSLGWKCEWPTPESLIDRRRATLRKRRPGRWRRQQQLNATVADDPNVEGPRCSEVVRICNTSASLAHQALSRDIKPHIFKYFIDEYYDLILLPKCHPKYYWTFFREIERLLPKYQTLQSTVLANAASHLDSTIESASLQELSLTYYSQALQGLQELLGSAPQLEENNGLLISIMLLYTLGVTGKSAYGDIPGHMKAAAKIATLRYFERQAATSQRFERLVLESVLYSMFMTSMGLWSEDFNSNNTFDLTFWLRAEQSLNRTNVFPASFPGVDSPVIGVPPGLLKLLLFIRQLRNGSAISNAYLLADLRSEISRWEHSIICRPGPDSPGLDESEDVQCQLARDAASLFIITASILTQKMVDGDLGTTIPQVHDPDSWELRRAMSILRKYQENETWSRFFTSTIPVYTMGFFTARSEDIHLIRQDLQRRWDFTKFGHLLLCRSDLEATWARRGCAG